MRGGAADGALAGLDARDDVSPNLGRSQGPFRTIEGGLHAVMVQEGAIELVGRHLRLRKL